MEGAILAILCEMLSQAILQYAQWEIKRKLDNAGKAISEFYALFDDDGDGQTDREELVFSFDDIFVFHSGHKVAEVFQKVFFAQQSLYFFKV